MRHLLILLIKMYRLLLSPMMGNACRFYPTCSSYGIEAISRHGCFYGSFLTVKRIIRCNPLCKGGIDHVPGTQDNLRETHE